MALFLPVAVLAFFVGAVGYFNVLSLCGIETTLVFGAVGFALWLYGMAAQQSGRIELKPR